MEHAVYFWSALIGCTLLGIQVLLQVIGLGGDADVDAVGPDVDVDGPDFSDAGDPAHGTSSNVFFGILSFKTLVAFVGIFGLTGLTLLDADITTLQRIVFSCLAGFAAMVLVAWMVRALYSMGASGSLILQNALGRTAEVYLHIPDHGSGRGKITVVVQGRSVELPAVTDGDALPTGTTVRITEIVGGGTVKVVPA